MTAITLTFRYVPEHWVDKLDNLPEEGLREINHLNTQLVHQLKSSDTAFSLGAVYIWNTNFVCIVIYFPVTEMNSKFSDNLMIHVYNNVLFYSIGTSSEALACVRFGLITDETDLEELIALVYTIGKEVEESSKVTKLNIGFCC